MLGTFIIVQSRWTWYSYDIKDLFYAEIVIENILHLVLVILNVLGSI